MRRHAIFVVLLLALAASACSGGDDGGGPEEAADPTTTTTTEPPPVTTEPPTTTSTTEATTTTTTLPPDVDAGLDLPRSGVYAHVVITLTSAEYSNDTPGTHLDDAPEQGQDRYLYVDYDMEFEDGYPGTSEDFEVANFRLALADGTEIVSEQVDFRRSVLVQDDRPQSVALAFAGDAFDLAGSSIVYDNEVDEPVSIALDGPVPEEQYPIVVSIDESGDVTYEGGCGDATGGVTVLEAEWDVDGGVDESDDQIVGAGSARTRVGERFVRIRLQATAASGTCGGTVFNDDAFRLLADGLPLGSENSFVTQLDDGEGVEVIFGFRVRVDVVDLELEVGTPAGTTERFEIPVPEILP